MNISFFIIIFITYSTPTIEGHFEENPGFFLTHVLTTYQ